MSNIIELSDNPNFRTTLKTNGIRLIKTAGIVFLLNLIGGLLIVSFALRHFERDDVYAAIYIGMMLLGFIGLSLIVILVVVLIVAGSIFLAAKQMDDIQEYDVEE